MAIGAAFMIAGRFLSRIISIISTLILARLLVPEDFGLVALAAVAFVLADQLSATNYAYVLVRRQEVDRSLYDTAWTMNLLRALLLGGVVAATADWQAGLLGDPRVAGILRVIALGVVLDGFASIGMARLQREMRFDRIVRLQVAGRLLSFVFAVLIAAVWQSYWALVLGNLAAKCVTVPLSYLVAPHRPSPTLRHWRELFGFSKWSFLLNLCAVGEIQGPSLVIGRMVGLHALGMSTSAYQIAAAPVHEVAVPIRDPMYSGYAAADGEVARVRRQFLEAFGLLALVITPMSCGIALVAAELEVIALGPAWAGTAPLIALSALYALVDCLGHFTHGVFIVLDRMRRLVAIYAVLVAIRVAVIIAAAAWYGVLGVLAGMLVTSLCNVVIWHEAAARLLGHRAGDALGQVWRSAAAAGAMAACVLALRAVLPPVAGTGVPAAVATVLQVALPGAAVHILAQWSLWRLAGRPAGPEARVLDFLVGRLRALRAGRKGSEVATPPDPRV